MSTTRPTYLPRWNSDATNRVEPLGTEKDAGFPNGARPASQTMNWLFGTGHEWIEHFAKNPVRVAATSGYAPETSGWAPGFLGEIVCTDAGPSSTTVDKTWWIPLPLAPGVTYPACRVRCKPGDATSLVRASLVRYRDGAIVGSALATGDSTTTVAWQDITLTASIALNNVNDVIFLVIGNLHTGTAERKVTVVELDPPTPA